jgi:hypothetical protein
MIEQSKTSSDLVEVLRIQDRLGSESQREERLPLKRGG